MKDIENVEDMEEYVPTDHENLMESIEKIQKKQFTDKDKSLIPLAKIIFEYIDKTWIGPVNKYEDIDLRKLDNIITLYVIALNGAIQLKMDEIMKNYQQYLDEVSNTEDANLKSDTDCQIEKGLRLNSFALKNNSCNAQIEVTINKYFRKAKNEFRKQNEGFIDKLTQRKIIEDNCKKLMKKIGSIIINASFSEDYETMNPGHRVYEDIHVFLKNHCDSIRLIRENSNSIVQYYDMFYEMLSTFQLLESNNVVYTVYADRNRLNEDKEIRNSIERIEKIWNCLNSSFYEGLLWGKDDGYGPVYDKLREIFPSNKIMENEIQYITRFIKRDEWPKRRLHVAGVNFNYCQMDGEVYNYRRNFNDFLDMLTRPAILKKTGNKEKIEENIKNEKIKLKIPNGSYFNMEEINDLFDVEASWYDIYKTICNKRAISLIDISDKSAIITNNSKNNYVHKGYLNTDIKPEIPSKSTIVKLALYAHATLKEIELLMQTAGYALSNSYVEDRFIRAYFRKAETYETMYKDEVWYTEYEIVRDLIGEKGYIKKKNDTKKK